MALVNTRSFSPTLRVPRESSGLAASVVDVRNETLSTMGE